ncbi:uncharacterized protein SOCE26_079090 [Sorangium cellulosum]|uniref:Uncharacterized protein n=1 Tax=Sorangium cellulosum TaxID=56 RepID=A0A2L0F4D7_SORCE|nr:uncharacterized protein SOCE26_079090 [Sorangium cellulosum]
MALGDAVSARVAGHCDPASFTYALRSSRRASQAKGSRR